mgnify:CR=1 FL=1
MPQKNNGFDSHEEYCFSVWLKRLRKMGLVSDIVYQPPSFMLSPRQSTKVVKQLKTKSKEIDRFLLHPHIYTADFKFKGSKSFSKIDHEMLKHDGYYYVDVKGSFAGGFRNSSAITFPINRKWVYEKYGIFVNKVIPEKLFKKTFIPRDIAYGKSGKLLKKWSKCKILE